MLLTAVTVDNSFNDVNGDTSSISALIANDGGDGISLREAIEASNSSSTSVDPGVVYFAPKLSGQQIYLGGSEYVITKPLTIDATALSSNVVLNANGQSRVFNFVEETGDLNLNGLTLQGGLVTREGSQGSSSIYFGGAIRSVTTGALTITGSTISDSSVFGFSAKGGAIFSTGELTIVDSIITGNRTVGDRSSGGGIYGPNVTILESTVTNNRTAGDDADGGGIAGLSVEIVESTVSDNRTTGDDARGGGIYGETVTISRSTIEENRTAGLRSHGGGIYTRSGSTINLSRISGNSTSGDNARGGGLYANASTTFSRTLVNDNSTSGLFASGGGVAGRGNVVLNETTVEGNRTINDGSSGGGLSVISFNTGQLTLNSSTISNNETRGQSSLGGGISVQRLIASQSTVSGNRTIGDQSHGGGIHVHRFTQLNESTIANNHAISHNSIGGGIYHSRDDLEITGSIIADNNSGSRSPDLHTRNGTLEISYTLIGDTTDASTETLEAINNGSGNIVDQSPLLSPLADHGGFSKTHALLDGSPALDAGDPSISFNESDFDQRGTLFLRVFDDPAASGAGVDIGAYERQSLASLGLVVDSTLDEYDGDFSAGNLTLRESIGLANGSVGNDIITFDETLANQQIALNGNQFEITESLVIDATSLPANVIVDGQFATRVFNVVAPSGDFEFHGLEIVSGNPKEENFSFDDNSFSGGAIRSLSTGTLTLNRSSVRNSIVYGDYGQGAGVYALGDVVITGSTLAANRTQRGGIGGSLFAAGDVTLSQSTISGSLAGHGGGIYAGGNLAIQQSTISGNRAYDGGNGGGIHANGVVVVVQSTITENIADSGGGIWTAGGPFTVRNSIIGNNTGNIASPDVHAGSGPIAVDYSLIGNTSGSSIDEMTGVGNILNQAPLLGPLQNNGGPVDVHALLSGSPAIDAGDPAAVLAEEPYDQRGAPFVRIADDPVALGLGIDIGAYERQVFDSDYFVVTTATNELDYTNTDVSLREAINAANGSVGSDTVTFNSSLSGETITLEGAALFMTESLTVDASNLPGGVTIDANSRSRVLDIAQVAGDFTFANLSITGGVTPPYARGAMDASDDGAGIRSLTLGNLQLISTTIRGNSAIGNYSDGGGVFAYGAVTLTNSVVSGNRVESRFPDGGGIHTYGDVTLINSTVEDNTVTDTRESPAGSGAYGAGIWSFNSVTLTGSVVRNNLANASAVGGAGIRSIGAVSLVDSIVSGNRGLGDFSQQGTPYSSGGGIFAHTVTLDSSTVSDNQLQGGSSRGGAIRAYSSVTATGSEISNNSTVGLNASGGAIYSRGDVTIYDSSLRRNSLDADLTYGGAVFSQGQVSIVGSTIADNKTLDGMSFYGLGSSTGGAIDARDRAVITQSSITNNSIEGFLVRGAGVAAPSVELTQSTISGNVANGFFTAAGGGISADSAISTQSTITGNQVNATDAEAGGIHIQGTSAQLDNSIVSMNFANGSDSNVTHAAGGMITANYSLLGADVTFDAGTSSENIITDDPLLGPLSQNGGATETHALMPGSPALDAGNATLPEDQRGQSTPIDLPDVTNASSGNGSDIGSYEAQLSPSADFDQDGDVDGGDFLTWQRGFGSGMASQSDGNSDDDTDVDASDLAAWQLGYGDPTSGIIQTISTDQDSIKKELSPFFRIDSVSPDAVLTLQLSQEIADSRYQHTIGSQLRPAQFVQYHASKGAVVLQQKSSKLQSSLVINNLEDITEEERLREKVIDTALEDLPRYFVSF